MYEPNMTNKLRNKWFIIYYICYLLQKWICVIQRWIGYMKGWREKSKNVKDQKEERSSNDEWAEKPESYDGYARNSKL